MAEADGGYVRVDRAPLQFVTPDLVWGTARADAHLVRALKSAYDVAGVCAPGRFVGGI